MPKEGGIILKQMKELGLKVPTYGADAWSVGELTAGAGETAEGVMYTYPAQFVGEAYQTFASAFRKKYGEEPDVNAAGAYDAVKILAMCISKVVARGLPLTGDNIKQEMERVKDYHGATGTTTFDENGDPIAKTFDKMIIRSSKRLKYGQ
jgi:branched-chain amino acid transport system substrate-binding protein